MESYYIMSYHHWAIHLKMVTMVNFMIGVFKMMTCVIKKYWTLFCENCTKIYKHEPFAGVYIVIQTLRDVARRVKATQTREHKHSAQIWRGSWIFTLPNRAKVSTFGDGGRAGCPHGMICLNAAPDPFLQTVSTNAITVMHCKITVLSFKSGRIRILHNSL